MNKARQWLNDTAEKYLGKWATKEIKLPSIKRTLAIGGLAAAILAGTAAPKKANAELYSFTGEPQFYGVELETYVDGDFAEMWGGSGNYWTPADINGAIGTALWDIDATALEATLLGIHTGLTGPITISDTINYNFGFGNQLEVPFSLNITTVSTDISSMDGPFTVNPNLSFSMGGVSGGDLTWSLGGEAIINGNSHSYNHSIPEGSPISGEGKFDDTNYPAELGLEHNLHMAMGSYKLAEETVDGHLVEIYANPHFLLFDQWEGELVPEPTTLGLLALGGLGLLAKKKE